MTPFRPRSPNSATDLSARCSAARAALADTAQELSSFSGSSTCDCLLPQQLLRSVRLDVPTKRATYSSTRGYRDSTSAVGRDYGISRPLRDRTPPRAFSSSSLIRQGPTTCVSVGNPPALSPFKCRRSRLFQYDDVVTKSKRLQLTYPVRTVCAICFTYVAVSAGSIKSAGRFANVSNQERSRVDQPVDQVLQHGLEHSA